MNNFIFHYHNEEYVVFESVFLKVSSPEHQ